jgi:hypothetical protein
MDIPQSEFAIGRRQRVAARQTGRCRIQIEDLGGRLIDSGARLTPARDGASATRSMEGTNGTRWTGLGRPAAQHAAHAAEQQSPTQLRSGASGTSTRFDAVALSAAFVEAVALLEALAGSDR